MNKTMIKTKISFKVISLRLSLNKDILSKHNFQEKSD